jgi:hypothetical protein
MIPFLLTIGRHFASKAKASRNDFLLRLVVATWRRSCKTPFDLIDPEALAYPWT